MADKPIKIRIVKVDLKDRAIVQTFYTDDGLFDGTGYDEWAYILENGDRSERDYADYEVQTSECD